MKGILFSTRFLMSLLRVGFPCMMTFRVHCHWRIQVGGGGGTKGHSPSPGKWVITVLHMYCFVYIWKWFPPPPSPHFYFCFILLVTRRRSCRRMLPLLNNLNVKIVWGTVKKKLWQSSPPPPSKKYWICQLLIFPCFSPWCSKKLDGPKVFVMMRSHFTCICNDSVIILKLFTCKFFLILYCRVTRKKRMKGRPQQLSQANLNQKGTGAPLPCPLPQNKNPQKWQV